MPTIRKLQMLGFGHREVGTPIPGQVKRVREKPIRGRPTVYYHHNFGPGDVLDYDVSDPLTQAETDKLVARRLAIDVTPNPGATTE